ncbi:MAG TPA: kelch repeat-containing protein, partial [Candidatus Acidoferrales bacterium]|nr:kelch repeat-containing protein [Candidatus Acidoferrales bacterium]
MRKLLKTGIVPLMMVLSLTLGSNGGVLQVRTGEWAPAANLLEARANSTATLLQDGRVLIAGGSDADGNALASAEFFGPDGSISVAAAMNSARSRHIAVALQDGRVLVAGGVGTNGMPLFSAEIFDPVTNSWSPAASGM